jgi:hypothetical protein
MHIQTIFKQNMHTIIVKKNKNKKQKQNTCQLYRGGQFYCWVNVVNTHKAINIWHRRYASYVSRR